MSGEHTATPWWAQTVNLEADADRGIVCIVGANLGGLVAAALPWPTELDSGDFSRVDANAAHIVRCVNAHDELVEALRSFLADYDGFDDFQLDRRVDEPMFRKIKAARLVVAKLDATP